MRRTSVTLVILLALSVALLPGGAAHAAKKTFRDAKRDLLAVDLETDQASKSSQANGDIVKTTVRHANRTVVVKTKFRELKKLGDFRGDWVRIVTNDNVKRNVTIYAGPGSWGGETEMQKPNGNQVDCNVTHKIDYGKNLVRVKVPRSCLDNPRWVRVGVTAFWVSGSTGYIDDANRKGKVNGAPKLSGRVRRG